MTESRPPAAELLETYRRGLLDTYQAQVDGLRQALQSRAGDEHHPLEPGGWSPHQVAWHVRAVETQAYLPRLERLLTEDHATLQDFDGEGWMARHYTPDEAWERIVDELQTARRMMRRRLEISPDGVWSRVGRHSYWGSRTLMWWVERSIAHLDEHIAHVSASAPTEP